MPGWSSLGQPAYRPGGGRMPGRWAVSSAVRGRGDGGQQGQGEDAADQGEDGVALIRTGGRRAAVWLVTALTVVYFVVAGAFAPSEPPTQDETTPPAASPASSPSSEPAPTAAATESITAPDVPETKAAEEPDDAPSTEEEADDNGGTGDQDFDGQVGIQFGYACFPVGALGIAEDGRPAKCFMGKDGRARWGYDSNRG
jgi:hypothetical protein